MSHNTITNITAFSLSLKRLCLLAMCTISTGICLWAALSPGTCFCFHKRAWVTCEVRLVEMINGHHYTEVTFLQSDLDYQRNVSSIE